MRMALPADLGTEELRASVSGLAGGPAEEFVTLPDGDAVGYLEMDLRPDHRYLYWTVPGGESEADGKVLIWLRRVALLLTPGPCHRARRWTRPESLRRVQVARPSARAPARTVFEPPDLACPGILVAPVPCISYGQVQRKKLSNDSDPAYFEDLSPSIRSGMADLGYNLTDPLGIALDLREKKVFIPSFSAPGQELQADEQTNPTAPTEYARLSACSNWLARLKSSRIESERVPTWIRQTSQDRNRPSRGVLPGYLPTLLHV